MQSGVTLWKWTGEGRMFDGVMTVDTQTHEAIVEAPTMLDAKQAGILDALDNWPGHRWSMTGIQTVQTEEEYVPWLVTEERRKIRLIQQSQLTTSKSIVY